MLQRIQTVWLLIAGLLSFSTFKFSFFSGNKIVDNAKSFISFTAKENLIVLILTVAVAVAALVTIFLYKDRKMQIKIAMACLVAAIINLVLAYFKTKEYVEGKMDLTALVWFAIPIFIFLAIRAIYKDEQLVKNADRLR
jgi:magnesium-transporting ATPase (P-type)